MNSDYRSEQLGTGDAPVLLAMALAARRLGDELLAKIACRELELRHHVRLTWGNPRHPTRLEATDESQV